MRSAQGDAAFNRCKYTACSARHRHARAQTLQVPTAPSVRSG